MSKENIKFNSKINEMLRNKVWQVTQKFFSKEGKY